MKCEVQHSIDAGMLSINSISGTEVCFIISVSVPTPIGTQYDKSTGSEPHNTNTTYF